MTWALVLIIWSAPGGQSQAVFLDQGLTGAQCVAMANIIAPQLGANAVLTCEAERMG